jgi:hypothetical protein
MGAPMPMPAWRTRTGKIECVLLVAVLGMFVPGFGHAETTGADAVKSGRQAEPAHAARAKPHAKPAPPSGQAAPRKTGRVDARPPTPIGVAHASPRAGTRRGPAVTTTPTTRPVMTNAGPATRPVMTNAGPAVSTTAAAMQNLRAVTVPNVTTNSRGAANVGGASGNGASGNTTGRRPSGAAVIGGPARYDAKHGAVIGGTVTGRKR